LILAGIAATGIEMAFPVFVRADLLVAIALAWSLRRDPTSSCIGAACLGFIGDMACDGRLGFGTATFGAAAFAVSTLRDRWRLSFLAQSAVALFAATPMLALFALRETLSRPIDWHTTTIAGLTTGVLAVMLAASLRCLTPTRLRYAH
jgi:cell shape-determining protein MreD